MGGQEKRVHFSLLCLRNNTKFLKFEWKIRSSLFKLMLKYPMFLGREKLGNGTMYFTNTMYFFSKVFLNFLMNCVIRLDQWSPLILPLLPPVKKIGPATTHWTNFFFHKRDCFYTCKKSSLSLFLKININLMML